VIHDNAITMAGSQGWAAGLLTDDAESRVAQGGNRFDANLYRVPEAAGQFWTWPASAAQGGALVDFAAFRDEYGQERAGRLAVAPPSR
jgi:hypothetical protein